MTIDTSSPTDHQAPDPDELLHRFIDGDLQGGDRASVAAILAGDAAALQRTQAYQQQTVLLQSLYPRQLEDTALPSAGRRLVSHLRQRRRLRQAFAASVACLALVGAGVGGWGAHQVLTTSPPPQVIAVFPPASTPALNQTADAQAEATPTIDNLAWLADHAAGIPIQAPQLESIGFTHVGGRADLTAYGPVLRFAYRGPEGLGLTVAVASFSQDRRSLTTSVDPSETSLFWAHNGQLYALSGSVAPSVLSDAAAAILAASQPATPVPVPVPLPAPHLPMEPTDDNVVPITPVSDGTDKPESL